MSSDTDRLAVRRWTDDLTRFVRDVGFPIAVSAYLLLGLGPKIDRQTEIMGKVLIVLEARR